MQVSIERIDENFLVRCLVPRNPPFKSALIAASMEEAFDGARGMFNAESKLRGGGDPLPVAR